MGGNSLTFRSWELPLNHMWKSLTLIRMDLAASNHPGTHSSVLSWRIPGTGEPSGLPSKGSHRVGHDWSDLAAAAAITQTPIPSVKLWAYLYLAAGSPEASGSRLVNSVAQPYQQGPNCYHSSPGPSSGHSSGPQTATLWTQIRKTRQWTWGQKKQTNTHTKKKSLAWIIFRTWQKQKLKHRDFK